MGASTRLRTNGAGDVVTCRLARSAKPAGRGAASWTAQVKSLPPVLPMAKGWVVVALVASEAATLLGFTAITGLPATAATFRV